MLHRSQRAKIIDRIRVSLIITVDLKMRSLALGSSPTQELSTSIYPLVTLTELSHTKADNNRTITCISARPKL